MISRLEPFLFTVPEGIPQLWPSFPFCGIYLQSLSTSEMHSSVMICPRENNLNKTGPEYYKGCALVNIHMLLQLYQVHSSCRKWLLLKVKDIKETLPKKRI
jgi:hypothetical protein